MLIRKVRQLLLFLIITMLLCNHAWAKTQNGSLCYGDQGDEVLQLQTALKSLGYNIGTADGTYGAYTENAVRKFQRKHGLKSDGIAGESTCALIYELAGQNSGATTKETNDASKDATASSSSFFGGDYSTIRSDSSEARIRLLQTALNALGYSCGIADGEYGDLTRSAVIAFQKAQKIQADGIAGKTTLKKLESARKNGVVASASVAAATSAQQSTEQSITASVTTLRKGMRGEEVKALQKALKTLGYYKGTLDGQYGDGTVSAVKQFQKSQKLTADGVAGALTQEMLKRVSAPDVQASGKTSDTPNATASVSVGKVKLLHWFNEIKPSVKTGQTILVVDPSTGISWNLKLYSLGRHADCEPLTQEDTANMVKAFGGVNTWNQKAVYVKLPSGTWTLASTHDMPHMSGAIKDNGFNGHLCVHFLRDMEECKQNDPNYGVANQETIRAAWKQMTGETIN